MGAGDFNISVKIDAGVTGAQDYQGREGKNEIPRDTKENGGQAKQTDT